MGKNFHLDIIALNQTYLFTWVQELLICLSKLIIPLRLLVNFNNSQFLHRQFIFLYLGSPDGAFVSALARARACLTFALGSLRKTTTV